jgi:hypothetical protein
MTAPDQVLGQPVHRPPRAAPPKKSALPVLVGIAAGVIIIGVVIGLLVASGGEKEGERESSATAKAPAEKAQARGVSQGDAPSAAESTDREQKSKPSSSSANGDEHSADERTRDDSSQKVPTDQESTAEPPADEEPRQEKKAPHPKRSHRKKIKFVVDQSIKNEIRPVLAGMMEMSEEEIDRYVESLPDKHGKKVIPVLIDLLLDGDEFVARYASYALSYLTGEHWMELLLPAEEGEPRRLYNDCRQWWEEKGARFSFEAAAGEHEMTAEELEMRVKQAVKLMASGMPSKIDKGRRQIRELGEDAVPCLIEILRTAKEIGLAIAADEALQEVTGQYMGTVDSTTRDEVASKWHTWWKKHARD